MMIPEDEDPDFDDEECHDNLSDDESGDAASHEPTEDCPANPSDSSEDDISDFMDILADNYRNAWDFGDDEFVSVVRTWMGSQARKTVTTMGRSYDSIRAELKWRFHQRVRRPYLQGFELLAKRSETKAALGRRYGMNRATVKRWLDGNCDPSFDAFCIVSVADDCHYPRGHRIALNTYADVLQTAQRLTGKSDIVPVSVDDVGCLYLQTQQKQWWLAWFSDDERLHAESSRRVREVLQCQFGSKQKWDRQEQVALYKKLWLEWAIVQEVIPYEWF